MSSDLTSNRTSGSMPEAVLDFIDRLEKAKIPMHALLIMHRGQLITEGYYAPFQKDSLHRMFSICKSLNALAIGLLEADGKLSLDDPVADFFPDKVPENAHPFITSMTVRNLLMMRTCHASTTYKFHSDLEWVESFFVHPPTHKPGTVFHYDTSAAHVLCMLVQRLSGKPMLDFLKDRVLRQIGWSEESYVIPNQFGDPQGGSGLMCTPMDLLLLGRLLMQHGQWEGKQLLPREFVDTAVSNLSPNVMTGPVNGEMQGYGYQIWRGEHNNFVLYGMGGQLVICMPDQDLICVTCADTQGMGGGNQFIYNSFYETVMTAADTHAAHGYPIQDNAARTRLENRLANLHIQPVIVQTALTYPAGTDIEHVKNTLLPSATCAAKVQGVTYQFTENASDFTSAMLTFSEDGQEGTLHYVCKSQDCAINFGLSACRSGRFPVYDFACAASGAWIAPDTLYIKCHIIDTSVGSVSMELIFGDRDVTIFMKKIEETMMAEYNGHFYGTLF